MNAANDFYILYIRRKDWHQTLRFMTSAINKCPQFEGKLVPGLADALIMLAEAYSELGRYVYYNTIFYYYYYFHYIFTHIIYYILFYIV